MDAKKQEIELLAPKIAASISVGLAIFKIMSGIKLSSVALLTSGFDSVFDALASSASYFFMKMSHQPADEDHPYGHSRIASITSLAQGAFLVGVSFLLAQSAWQKLHNPFPAAHTADFVIVASVASVVTILLCTYLTYVVRKTKSQIVAADRLHYLTDLGGNALLFFGFLVGARFEKYNMDSLLTFALCIFIVIGAYQIIVDSINNLVDRHDPEVEKKISTLVKQFHPQILGVGRIRSRKAGHLTAIDVELISCRLKSLQYTHDLVHQVEAKILEDLPYVDVFIHAEPCSYTDCKTDKDCKLK